MHKLTCIFAVTLILCQVALVMSKESNKPKRGNRDLEKKIADWKNSVLSEVKKTKTSLQGLFQSSGFKSGIEQSRQKLENVFFNLFGNKTGEGSIKPQLGTTKHKTARVSHNYFGKHTNGGALQAFASGLKRAKQKIEEEFQKSIKEDDATLAQNSSRRRTNSKHTV